ncbi:hypothetical protein D3C75_598380 [compost metagenome]
MLAGLALALGAHALEHAAVDLLGQVDGLDPHVEHLDAQLATRHAIQQLGDVGHQRIALAGHYLVQGALAELVTQTRLQTPRQTLVGDLFHARGRGVEALGVGDPPLGEGVDHHRLLLQGEEALGRRIQGQQTRVELAHLVDVGDLHVQTRLHVGLDDAPELQQHRLFGLQDDVEAVPAHQRQHGGGNQGDQRLVAHQRLSLERRSRCRSLFIRGTDSAAPD